MPEYVRVKQKETGHELTVSRSMYDFAPDAYALLDDRAATDAGNNPLPAKYKTTVSTEAAKKKANSGRQAATEGDN